MHQTSLSTTALLDIDLASCGAPALAGEIATRFQNGDEEEVIHFIRTCDVNLLHALSWMENDQAAWQRDAVLWRQLARLTGPRGVLWREPPEEQRQRDQAFSHEMRALAEDWLASSEQQGRKPADATYFVLTQVIYRLVYPSMPAAEALELIAWSLALRRIQGVADDAEYNCGWEALIATLKDTADLLAIAEQAGRLCHDALRAFRERSHGAPARQRMLPWHEFFQRHTDLFDACHHIIVDPALVAWRWPAANKALRHTLMGNLLRAIPEDEGDDQLYFIETVDTLIGAHEALFAKFLLEDSYAMSPPLAKLIWDKQCPKLVPLLLPLIVAKGYPMASYGPTLDALLLANPAALDNVAAASLDRVLLAIAPDTLRALLPALAAIIGKSSAKSLREAIVKAAKKLSPGDIAAAGWLAVRNKNLRQVCKELLLAHPDKAASAALLAGMDASAAAVPAHATPEAQAGDIKRLSVAIKAFDTTDTLAMLRPLSEHAARVVLHLAATEPLLPPLALALLAQVPAENLARLAHHLLQTWIAAEGEPKLRWLVRLASTGADESLADLLAGAVLAWGKPKKQRALIALEQLAALDTPYALARVLEISESGKVKDTVIEAANTALRSAAQRRNLGMGELLDTLTPDFGLGKGITLAVGAQSYRLLLQGDLSLRLVDAKGKASKTLPANKDSATAEAWTVANGQFKTIAAGLKTIIKRQAPRLEAALVSEQTWTATRWRELFLDQPVLRIMAGSLLWRIRGEAGRSFRISEDYSLLTVDDEVLELPADALIALWHPVTATKGEVQAWSDNFGDYELLPLIDQLGAPAELPPNAALAAPAHLSLAQEQLSGLLKKWGFRQGPIGDGPSIEWHEWPLPAAQLSVRLLHGYFPPFMSLGNPVSVEGFEVRDGKGTLLAPGALPKPLLATLCAYLQTMTAKRIA